MLIVLEGPDGAGKTTFAERLAKHFGGRTTIEHRGPLAPEVDPVDEYTLPDYDRSDPDHLVICDRWHLSEMVYGTHYRGASRIDGGRWYFYEQWLRSRGALKLYLSAPLQTLQARVETRGDDYIEVEHLPQLIDRFSRVLNRPGIYDWLPVDTSTTQLEPEVFLAGAEFRRKLVAPFHGIHTYIGRRNPSVVYTLQEAFEPWEGRRFSLEPFQAAERFGGGLVQTVELGLIRKAVPTAQIRELG